jgi:hypothetical protein
MTEITGNATTAVFREARSEVLTAGTGERLGGYGSSNGEDLYKEACSSHIGGVAAPFCAGSLRNSSYCG